MNKAMTIKEQLLKGAAVAVSAVLFVVLFCLFIGAFDRYYDAGFLYSVARKPERILLAFLSMMFFAVFSFTLKKALGYCSDKIITVISVVLWILFLFTQIYFLFVIRSYYKWDSGFVIGAAASLAEQGSVAEEAFYYLSVYPNQNTFVIITAALIKLANLFGVSVANRPFVFNVFNTILMDASLVLFLTFLKKFYYLQTDSFSKIDDKLDIKKELCFAQILLFCNPFLYLGVSYYYTITLSWFFTMGFIYALFADYFEKKSLKKSILYWSLAGLLLGVGYELRATAIIFAVAGIVILLMCLFRNRVSHDAEKDGINCKKICVKIVVIIVVALLASQILSTSQKAYVGIDTTNTAFPTTHWLMMSLTEPGGHNAQDEEFTASFATKEEKVVAVNARISEKLHTMGVKGYAHLVGTKLKRTFGDGMNGYTTFLADGYGTGTFYDAVFGGKKDFVILWHQGYYLFVMLGILYAIVAFICKAILGKKTIVSAKEIIYEKAIERKEFYVMFFMIVAMLGAILFYILWEASEQYSVPFMLLMIFLGLVGIKQGQEDVEAKLVNLKSTSNKYLSIESIYAFISFVCVFILFCWSIVRYQTFVNSDYAQSCTAATQILANAPTVVDDGETMVQNLQVNRPCNHLVMQWRNPLGEENDSEYDVTFSDAKGNNIYLKEHVVAAENGMNGAGIYDFPTVNPNGECKISIQKKAGSEDCDLQFVLYDMYGYTPYPGGALEVYDQNGNCRVTDASLLFLLTEEKVASYTTPKKYIFFMTCIFLIFLFMGICSKIEEIGLFQKWFKKPQAD